MTTQWQRRIDQRAALPYAVYLGANTAKRLAEEWGIPLRRAGAYLSEARESGTLRAHKDGMHLRYSLRKAQPGMVKTSGHWSRCRAGINFQKKMENRG